MPPRSNEKPALLWTHRDNLGRTPLELIGVAHDCHGAASAGFVPVVIVPLIGIAECSHIEGQVAEFETDGIRVRVSVIAGNPPGARAKHSTRKSRRAQNQPGKNGGAA